MDSGQQKTKTHHSSKKRRRRNHEHKTKETGMKLSTWAEYDYRGPLPVTPPAPPNPPKSLCLSEYSKSQQFKDVPAPILLSMSLEDVQKMLRKCTVSELKELEKRYTVGEVKKNPPAVLVNEGQSQGHSVNQIYPPRMSKFLEKKVSMTTIEKVTPPKEEEKEFAYVKMENEKLKEKIERLNAAYQIAEGFGPSIRPSLVDSKEGCRSRTTTDGASTPHEEVDLLTL